MALIPIFKIWNTVNYNSVDKEKIKLIMICVRTQLFTNNDRLLRNSPSWRQFKIRSADQVPCPNFSPWASGVLLPPRGNFLDHNIIVPTCLRVRKMHVGTRIKGAFGHYGLFIKPRQTGKKFLALNSCSFLNTDPIFTK